MVFLFRINEIKVMSLQKALYWKLTFHLGGRNNVKLRVLCSKLIILT